MTSSHRRIDDEDDGLDGSPWYVKSALRMGIPAAIACALVWFLMGSVTSSLAAIRGDVLMAKDAIVSHASHDAEVISYMRLICVNTAKTDQDRYACLKGDR